MLVEKKEFSLKKFSDLKTTSKEYAIAAITYPQGKNELPQQGLPSRHESLAYPSKRVELI
jgi:hypothetical protein